MDALQGTTLLAIGFILGQVTCHIGMTIKAKSSTRKEHENGNI